MQQLGTSGLDWSKLSPEERDQLERLLAPIAVN
jgi:hypothetical protein